jgi:group I intron endonuclease
MKNYIIYKHTSPSGKIYIGQTCQSHKQRWRSGKGYKNNQYLCKAMDKYGWDNFKHEIITTDLTKKEADWVEKYLIAYYHSNEEDFGYNLTKGGEGCIGFKQTNEVKERISKANKGRKRTEEQKEKYRKSHIGLKASEDAKKKMSESRKKWLLNPDNRKKCANYGENNGMYGRRGESSPNFGKHHIGVPCSDKKKEQQSKAIFQCDLNNNIIKKYKSITEASLDNNITIQGISMCCRGIIKTYKKYIWSYAI